MIERLPLEYREAVNLVELEGLTNQEAASRLGISSAGMNGWGDGRYGTSTLEELAQVGPIGSSRKWWAFEGFSDIRILTVVLKRIASCS